MRQQVPDETQVALTDASPMLDVVADSLVVIEAARSLQKLEFFLGAVAARCRAS